MLPNQRAITLLAKDLASQKNSWVYIAQPTGTGKTTEMLEIGYLMALDCLPATGKTTITVYLVVPSKEQAQLYQKRFQSK